MCKTLTSCSKPAERLTCAVEMRPQIHAANTHGVSHSSSHHSCHHHTMQCCMHMRRVKVTRSATLIDLVHPFYSIEFGEQGCKTYGLQQGSDVSDVSGGARSCIHAARTYGGSPSRCHTCAIITHCYMHMRHLQVACSIWTCKVCFGGILTTFRTVQF